MKCNDFNQQTQLCIAQFNAEAEVAEAEKTIRAEHHDSVVDDVRVELDLDDWDGDLDSASRKVVREYESWMSERIDDEFDSAMEKQIKEHIDTFFDAAVISAKSNEMASLEKALLLKVKQHTMELDYASLELAGLIYSDTIPGNPFMYHQKAWETDKDYRTFMEKHYEQIVTLSQQLQEQYRVNTLRLIPAVKDVVEESGNGNDTRQPH